MAIQTAYTKRGDTEIVVGINYDLTSATSVKAFVRDSAGADSELPCVATDEENGIVTVTTSSLDVGKYKLEVQVTAGGKIATYPDSGYLPLSVVQDLGD